MKTKTEILSEIKRTAAANGGLPLGIGRFEAETEIKPTDWQGIHWAKWGDALREAGFQPNKLNSATDESVILRSYAELIRKLNRLPTSWDLRLERRGNADFPSHNTFGRFGSKAALVKKLLEFCRSDPEMVEVLTQCETYLRNPASIESERPAGV